jgi:hypothetical protein
VNYKNKQLREQRVTVSFSKYHIKKEGYPNLSSDINKLDSIKLLGN